MWRNTIKIARSWSLSCGSLLITAILQACAQSPVTSSPPPYNMPIWSADSKTSSIRRQTQTIRASDLEFDDFLCIRYGDFECFYLQNFLGVPCPSVPSAQDPE
jgi:hypothetical protein